MPQRGGIDAVEKLLDAVTEMKIETIASKKP